MDIRERMAACVDAGLSRNAVAKRFAVAPSTVIKLLQARKVTGSVKPGKIGGHVKPKISGEHQDWVLQQVAGGGDVTFQGLADGLAARGLKVDYRSIWNFMQREGKSFKKAAYGDEQARPDVARKRHWWRRYLMHVDISRFVFIDETWIKTNMAPLRGWGTRGKRLVGWALHGRWKTLTFLAGLRVDGIIAPWLLNGPINGESGLLYVREVLAPTLRKGDFVVTDNLGSHKAKAIRDAVRSVGARLIFLPPYSPELNPIEQFFAKLKHHLRKLKARTDEALNTCIGDIIRATSKTECTNCVTSAGYSSV